MIKKNFKLLFMFGLCGFLPAFIASAINLSLPSIGKEFGMNVVALSWVATAYMLSTAVFLLPFGRLADIIGRKKIFIAGVIFFTVTSVLCSLSNSGNLLVIARSMQGIGSAMIFGTATAILVSTFPARERGKAIGINVTGVYMGMASGPSLGGIMTQYLGWRSLFIMTAILGIIVIGMAISYIKEESAEAKDESFDIIGSILYGISVVALLYGTTKLPALSGYAIMATGIIGFLLFCILEDHMKHPIFDIDLLLKNRRFAMSNIAALLNFCSATAVPFLMSLYLQYVKGMEPKIAGLFLLAQPFIMALGSPIAGKLSDEIDPRIVASIGMTLTTTALLIMGFIININTPLYVIVMLLVVFGAGLSFFSTPNTNAAMGAVSKKNLGIASSVISSMRLFGQTISMGISMLVLSLIVGKLTITNAVLPELIKSTKIILLIFGILSMFGIFASLARGRQSEEENKN